MKQISERVRLLTDTPENENAKYALYWMQMFKRTTHTSHALKFAIEQTNEGARASCLQPFEALQER